MDRLLLLRFSGRRQHMIVRRINSILSTSHRLCKMFNRQHKNRRILTFGRINHLYQTALHRRHNNRNFSRQLRTIRQFANQLPIQNSSRNIVQVSIRIQMRLIRHFARRFYTSFPRTKTTTNLMSRHAFFLRRRNIIRIFKQKNRNQFLISQNVAR